jgi:DNA mismatch repair ATPase MutS
MFNADLLYCTEEHLYKKQKIVDDNVFEDLKISQIFKFCAPLNLDNINAKDIKYSLEILHKPCQVKKDILYRQDIFKKFLAAPGFVGDLYINLQDVTVLEKIRETYDFDYGGETGIEYLKAVNYIFFIKSYMLFLNNIYEVMKDAELGDSGLTVLFQEIKAERDKFNLPEITRPVEEFLARFENKKNITGELQTQSGVFHYFNFDWDLENIKCSYEEAFNKKRVPFFELLKNLEDFLDIYRQEYEVKEKGKSFKNRTGKGEELYTPEKYTNFEKHFILQLIYDEEAEHDTSFAPLVKRIIEIHDSIDISCFAKLAGQIKFYRTVCKVINIISTHIECNVCYPEIVEDVVRFEINGIIDTVVAAQKLGDFQERNNTANLPESKITDVIPNDISFSDKNLFVVTGPNNGGKTAFARALGIAGVFFGAGAPIFAESAAFSAGLNILTHFTANETHLIESGRLQDELNRLNRVIEKSDEYSFVILNETFAGTNSMKALDLFENFLKDRDKIKFLCVYVTHFHNIAFHVEENSGNLKECGNLIAMIDPHAQIRTYKVLPANPSDTSYSRDIVVKHSLSWEQISAKLNIV